ncbi:GDP-mannose 4,6-dehydratase [archaeon]|nr:GDP-mannose 4,6-dehydratase [archaeon]|tara:strand:+ start:476 stop:1522 length:1047 start_codon:yes stop_codon:yes gene_type:complete
MPRALITGITGQDGSYLSEFLVSKGYEVFGLVRRTSADPLERINDIVKEGSITLLSGNLRDLSTIRLAMEKAKPDEVYNLAAMSHVGVSFDCPDETWEVNYYGVGRVINEALRVNPKVSIYQASTSEMFGSTPPPQNEQSNFAPVSPYGESKLKAHNDFVKQYREKHNVFVCAGILFNHESPRRGKQFVTRKVTNSLAKIALGLQENFAVGNLEATRDWGFAGDYVKAMHSMLQQDKPEDFVIATGKSHSVRQLIEVGAKALNLDLHWEGSGLDEVAKDSSGVVRVKVDKKFYRPVEVDDLRGDSSKAQKALGWKPEVSFDQLIEMMVKADYDSLKKEIGTDEGKVGK